jgi:uncharacterized membrane protein
MQTKGFATSLLILLFGVTPLLSAIQYTFFTIINVDFTSHKEDLFGCAASGINDRGLIVGGCNDQNQNSDFRGFLYDGRRFSEILVHQKRNAASDATMGVSPLARSVYQSTAFQNQIRGQKRSAKLTANLQDINNSGHMTGIDFDNDRDPRLQGFLRKDGNGNTITLVVPKSTLTEAVGLNDADDVVGDYRDRNGVFHGFFYRQGTYRSFDFPSGGDTGASGINNLGQIVGCYSLCGHGFVYDPHTSSFITIDVPGSIMTQARDINDSGQIVGVYSSDGIHARSFLYDRNGFTSIDVPGVFGTSVNGINNFGHIVGTYVVEVSSGVFEHHAFVALR